eukprot:6184009-Pleurochrysis_carterae.AAC.3
MDRIPVSSFRATLPSASPSSGARSRSDCRFYAVGRVHSRLESSSRRDLCSLRVLVFCAKFRIDVYASWRRLGLSLLASLAAFGLVFACHSLTS